MVEQSAVNRLVVGSNPALGGASKLEVPRKFLLSLTNSRKGDIISINDRKFFIAVVAELVDA